MGTIQYKVKTAIVGIALVLLASPFLPSPATAPPPAANNWYAPWEFTDVRIIRLDLAGSHSGVDFVRRVTIVKDFSVNSAWCQWKEPMALPCPNRFLDQHHERNHQDIPSL